MTKTVERREVWLSSASSFFGAILAFGGVILFVVEPRAENIAEKKSSEKVLLLEGKISTIQSQQQAVIGNQIRFEEKTKNIEGDVGEIKGDLKALQVDIQELLRRTPR